MKIEGPIPNHILKLMPKEDRPIGIPGMTHEEIEDRNQKRNEREIQGQISNYLRLREIVFCNPRMDKKSNIQEGWPDFSFAYCSIPIGLEVKTSSGTASGAQIATHERMRRNGWQVFIVRSVEEVKVILDTIEYGQRT